MNARVARRRVIITVLLPWLTAKFLFKPRVGPLREDRILDRLVFWRSVVGIVVIMLATYRFQDAMDVSGKTFLKTLQTGALALYLLPLSFLVMLIVTRPGHRVQLLAGAVRLLGRGALALILFLLPFLLPSEVDFTNPDPRAAVFFILTAPLVIVWFCCFWCCTIYWAARTGFWTGEMSPLLAPIGTTVLMLLLNGQEIIGGDTDTVPYPLWLTLNLCGTTTALTLAVLEYRHLRSIGYRFRNGPGPVTVDEHRAHSHTEEPASGAAQS